MAEESEEKPAATPAKSGGMMGMLMGGAITFVMALAAVIVGGNINAKMHPAPSEYKLDKDSGSITAVEPVSSGGGGHGGEGGEGGKPANFLPIDPPLVVNFEDGSVVRFLQVSMEIQARDPKALESVTKNMPLIRNNLLLLMSNRNYQTLMSREGKEKLRQEALTEIRAIQKKQGGSDVEDLLFTSFVVQ